MKLYVGINLFHSYIYLTALDNEGVAVFKTCFPPDCPPPALTDTLQALQQAFSVPLRIAICFQDYTQPNLSNKPLAEAILRAFPQAKSFSPSIFYCNDILPLDDPDFLYEPYQYPILLAVLMSLAD